MDAASSAAAAAAQAQEGAGVSSGNKAPSSHGTGSLNLNLDRARTIGRLAPLGHRRTSAANISVPVKRAALDTADAKWPTAQSTWISRVVQQRRVSNKSSLCSAQLRTALHTARPSTVAHWPPGAAIAQGKPLGRRLPAAGRARWTREPRREAGRTLTEWRPVEQREAKSEQDSPSTVRRQVENCQKTT